MLETADMPKGAVVPESDEEIGEVNETDTVVKVEEANDINTAVENLMLQTSEASGTHTYIYIIIVTFVFGLAVIAFMLTRRFRKE